MEEVMKIVAISISDKKGVKKRNVDKAIIKDNYGIAGDAHAGFLHRQISFLSMESIKKMVTAGLSVKPGDFAENIVIDTMDHKTIAVGDILKINNIEFIITQKGKICHTPCTIYYAAGDCIMPKEGLFAMVKGEGTIVVGDEVVHISKNKLNAAIITLSDRGSQNLRVDETGPNIINYLKENFNFSFIRYDLIPDDKDMLNYLLSDLINNQHIDLIITNGSTGVSERDIAPDITAEIVERRLPGFEEAMRMESFKKTPHAIIPRSVCGVRKKSLVINLPGSPKGALENLSTISDAILHTIEKLQGSIKDCAEK
jgi:molybdenum cofactor synthesis domain-containing protein